MGSLKYVGKKPPTANSDLVYQDYVTTVKGGDLTADQIDQAINSGLAGYANVSYVDTQDGLLATQAYVDAKDNLRLKLSQKGQPNGIAGLDARGKVSPTLINSPANQLWQRGPWSPANYGASTDFTTETTIFSCGVTDPGYPYRLIVWGEVDTRFDDELSSSQFYVRQGNASTGTIIAMGRGPNDTQDTAQFAGDDFERADANNLGPGWEQIYASYPDGTGGDNTSGGRLGISGGRADWPQAGRARTCHCRAINPLFQYTGTDRQRVFVQIGSNGDPEFAGQGKPFFRLYTRVADDWSSYVGIHNPSSGPAELVYRTPTSGGEQLLTTAPSAQPSNNELVVFTAGEYDLDIRRFRFYRAGNLILDYTDNAGVTAFGSTNRGWGMAQHPGQANLGQTKPPNFESIWVNDAIKNFSPAIIVPKDLNTLSPSTGPTTLYVRAFRNGAAGTGRYNNYKPKLHVMAVPA